MKTEALVSSCRQINTVDHLDPHLDRDNNAHAEPINHFKLHQAPGLPTPSPVSLDAQDSVRQKTHPDIGTRLSTAPSFVSQSHPHKGNSQERDSEGRLTRETHKRDSQGRFTSDSQERDSQERFTREIGRAHL